MSGLPAGAHASLTARRRLASLLVGPLLGLLLPELAVRHAPAFWGALAETFDISPARADGLLGLSSRGEAAVVVLGSSVAFSAVDEVELDRRLGWAPGATLNLSVGRDSAADTAMLVPRIEALSPRAVVWVVSLFDLPRAYEPRPAGGSYDPRIALRVFAGKELWRDRDWHLRGLLSWASVLRRHGPTLLAGALLPEAPGARTRFGREAPPLHGAWLAASLQDSELLIERGGFDGSGPNVRALEAVAQRLAAGGTPLLLVQGPLHPALRGPARVEESYALELERLLEQAAGEAGRLWPTPPGAAPRGLRDAAVSGRSRAAGIEHLTAAQVGSFAAPEFRDGMHLDHRGRRRFGEAVAAALDRLLQDADVVQ